MNVSDESHQLKQGTIFVQYIPIREILDSVVALKEYQDVRAYLHSLLERQNVTKILSEQRQLDSLRFSTPIDLQKKTSISARWSLSYTKSRQETQYQTSNRQGYM